MADAFATPADVAAAWRALTPDEFTFAEFWLEQASQLIRDQFPTVDARVTAGTLSAITVKGVAVAMVLRMAKNPEGIYSVQESIEDYSVTNVRDKAVSTGELYLSDGERARLSIRQSSNAFSITQQQEPATYAMYEQIGVHRAGWDR